MMQAVLGVVGVVDDELLVEAVVVGAPETRRKPMDAGTNPGGGRRWRWSSRCFSTPSDRKGLRELGDWIKRT